MINKLALTALLTLCLSACDGESTIVSQLTTQLGAAGDHPCADQFDYQFELNGTPDDTRQSSSVVEGETIFTEQHWYEDTSMILYYTYAEGGNWCNNWNENGVSWN
jgi:hypothetical protein